MSEVNKRIDEEEMNFNGSEAETQDEEETGGVLAKLQKYGTKIPGVGTMLTLVGIAAAMSGEAAEVAGNKAESIKSFMDNDSEMRLYFKSGFGIKEQSEGHIVTEPGGANGATLAGDAYMQTEKFKGRYESGKLVEIKDQKEKEFDAKLGKACGSAMTEKIMQDLKKWEDTRWIKDEHKKDTDKDKYKPVHILVSRNGNDGISHDELVPIQWTSMTEVAKDMSNQTRAIATEVQNLDPEIANKVVHLVTDHLTEEELMAIEYNMENQSN